MNKKIDPMTQSQLPLRLDRNPTILLDESARREIVELLALLLSTAVAVAETPKEPRDETV